MRKSYLKNLTKKLSLDEEFTKIIYDMLEKLRHFGYISTSREYDLVDSLYENVDKLYLKDDDVIDYKTGYYDSHRKILYIKDITDKVAVYQRLLYAMTTRKIDDKKYMTGYSYSGFIKNSFKIYHENYGINRAVVANLAAALNDEVNNNININVIYKTYERDFLDNKIKAENDSYYLESNIFSQMCFAFNIKKEEFYMGLFDRNPIKYMENIFVHNKFEHTEFLEYFDKISKEYSNYNKLNYLSKCLNDSCIKVKSCNDDDKLRELEKGHKKILFAVKDATEKCIDEEKETKTTEKEDVESLNGIRENLQNDIVSNIIDIQDILANDIITRAKMFGDYEYATKLKIFNEMLVLNNQLIEQNIFDTICYKLLKNRELTCINLIEKIKYSIIQDLISSEKFIKVYKDFSFVKLNGLGNEDSVYILMITEGSIVRVLKIDDVQNNIKYLKDNTSVISIDNFKSMMNSDIMNIYEERIVKTFRAIRKNEYFNKIKVEDIYTFSVEENMYVVYNYRNKLYVMLVDDRKVEYEVENIELSEVYSIFNKAPKSKESLLPVLYEGKFAVIKRLFRRLFTFNGIDEEKEQVLN